MTPDTNLTARAREIAAGLVAFPERRITIVQLAERWQEWSQKTHGPLRRAGLVGRKRTIRSTRNGGGIQAVAYLRPLGFAVAAVLAEGSR